MIWHKRLKFWLWLFWLEHPIILVGLLALGYAAMRGYGYYRNNEFWKAGYAESEARVTGFGQAQSRRGRFAQIQVVMTDGTRTTLNAPIDEVQRCRAGDRVMVHRKEGRHRIWGQCFGAETR